MMNLTKTADFAIRAMLRLAGLPTGTRTRSAEIARHTDDSGAPIRDESGGIKGAILVFRDITARLQVQRALADSERRDRLLFENNPQPMWVYHRESLKFLAVNRAAAQQYGYDEVEFLSMTLRDIGPAQDIPAFLKHTSQPVQTLHTAGQRHKKKDGTIIMVEIASHPIEFAGAPACFVLATDVTEREKLTQQLEQSQRLESMGRLVGGVAHDFNNLLTVINGYAAMLLEQAAPGSGTYENLAEIGGAGAQASALTQQLLAFSRRRLVQPIVLNLNHVVLDMEKMLGRLIGEDIGLRCRLAPDLGHIVADSGQMQQVIMNLAVNARDAMPRGGRLVIETENVEVDSALVAAHPDLAPAPHILLVVSDTGTGMSAEVRSQIFEPFFTTKAVGAGTGLGLATVYGMVKQRGGSIWVHSEPGQGTTFKIYLPRVDAPLAEPASECEADLRGTETVLVAEDQAEVRHLIVKALKRYGYRTISAASGLEALRLAEEFDGPIHVLLADVVMPGLSGQELAERLLGQRPDVRVLYTSGYTDEDIARRGVIDPAVALIPKPFTSKSLAKRVRQLLENQEARPTGR
jgi:PAS domain S-box-containing protein